MAIRMNSGLRIICWMAGGADLKDLYIGSIRAGYVLKGRSPVAGQPHVHQLEALPSA